MAGTVLGSVVLLGVVRLVAGSPAGAIFNDCHVHLTDYVQKGTDIHAFLRIMGNRAGRAALFGIPLQQQWSYRVTGNNAPTYYLESDAPLYYYSFTDAVIANAFRSLTPAEQARFDPMITGFNPTDMYAVDHIRRVLLTYPGVFEGIGEFTIHKEFVSSKVAGDVASLLDPALDRILDFAGEVGLVVLIHNDMNVPFPNAGKPPAYLEQLASLFRRHPKTTIIWAHGGVGRVVQPAEDHAAMLEWAFSDPRLAHLYIDISWSEVAKYLVDTPLGMRAAAAALERHPDRVLFGTDEVAPTDEASYLRVYKQYEPLLALLSERTRMMLLKGNYERLFDRARRRVRTWEAAEAQRSPGNPAP
jgi:hypothetical protein